MKKYKINISPAQIERDLIIIYKRRENEFHELKTCKVDFFRTLRYFQQKNNENNHPDLIYIQEDISYDIFERFILSIINKEIEINEDEISDFLYLSKKYKYNELYQKIEEISKDQDDYISSTSDHDDINSDEMEKEEIIPKNIDDSIQNGFLSNIPLKKLFRILTNPKRIIKDHHLLF